MLLIRLKAASNVSVMLFASPHQAKQLVSRIKGQRIPGGTILVDFREAGTVEAVVVSGIDQP
jgi:hypothetical protein